MMQEPNPTERRYPRTLQEAFGPYTSSDFGDRGPRLPSRTTLILSVVAIAIGAALLAYFRK